MGISPMSLFSAGSPPLPAPPTPLPLPPPAPPACPDEPEAAGCFPRTVLLRCFFAFDVCVTALLDLRFLPDPLIVVLDEVERVENDEVLLEFESVR
jgi:hypothetical protein